MRKSVHLVGLSHVCVHHDVRFRECAVSVVILKIWCV